MAYLLFTRNDGRPCFMETTGVLLVKDRDGGFTVFEQNSESPLKIDNCEGCETLASALEWLSRDRK